MAERLSIAQVAPVAESIRADSSGSIEQVVWNLTEELVRQGHDVTLFGTGDSETSATLASVYARGYTQDDDIWDDDFHESMHMASVFERASEFDVIHSHAYHYALPFSRFAQSAVLHTHHILPNPDVVRAYARYPEAHVAAISDYQRQSFWPVQTVAVVHHGLNTEWFPFGARRGDYLAFLGRMLPDKGPLEAIGIAREVGMRLVLAGPDEDDYFRDAVAPQVDNRWVEYIGPVDRRSRGELLSKAAALVYPITEPEPFGLVMVEAMLCGTPVAAMRLGAVAEIVDEGITGLTAESVPELAARIDATLALDRHRVRSTALERFNHVRMTGDYLNVYRQLIGSRVAIHDRAASTGHLRAS